MSASGTKFVIVQLGHFSPPRCWASPTPRCRLLYRRRCAGLQRNTPSECNTRTSSHRSSMCVGEVRWSTLLLGLILLHPVHGRCVSALGKVEYRSLYGLQVGLESMLLHEKISV